MSTKITAIYEALVGVIEEALPEHRRFQYVDVVENNPAPILRRGWGLEIGAGRNTNRNICPNYSLARTFSLYVSREILAKDSDPVRREAEKIVMLEDLHLILAAVVAELTLNETAVGIVYEDDGAPQEVQSNDGQYALIEARFTVEYIQQVSGG